MLFVKRLGGALRILAERGPFDGRQAGRALWRATGGWRRAGLMRQTQTMRSIMFSGQQLRWQDIRADSGAAEAKQAEQGKVLRQGLFPLVGNVCLCERCLTICLGAQVCFYIKKKVGVWLECLMSTLGAWLFLGASILHVRMFLHFLFASI